MSSIGGVATQNYTHFYWTQEIWNEAWHSNDAYSLPSITAKIACVVFPILLSVAITEGIIWAARSILKVSSDPKIGPLDAESVKPALPELVKLEKPAEQPLPEEVVQGKPEKPVEQPLPEEVVQGKPEKPVEQPLAEEVVQGKPEKPVEQPLPEEVVQGKPEKPNFSVEFVQLSEQALPIELQEMVQQAVLKKISSMGVENFLESVVVQRMVLKEGSSQHDIVDNEFDPDNLRPPACVYHAMHAAKSIASGFDFYEQSFRFNRVNFQSEFQRQSIISGTKDYFNAVTRDPSLKQALDLENIKIKDPDSLARLHLHLAQVNLDLKPIEERASAIVEHLFIPREAPQLLEERNIVQIAFLKNGKNAHMAVVCAANKAIFFNSHHNLMTLTHGKEVTKRYLISVMKEEGDQHPFSYTLGQYNTIKNNHH